MPSGKKGESFPGPKSGESREQLEATLAKAKALYLGGKLTNGEIGALCNRSSNIIGKWASDKGWKATRLAERGASVDKIAMEIVQFPLSSANYCDHLAQETKILTENAPENREDTIAELLRIRQLPIGEAAIDYQERARKALQKIPFIIQSLPPFDLLKHATALDKLDQMARRALGITESSGNSGRSVINIGIANHGGEQPVRISEEEEC